MTTNETIRDKYPLEISEQALEVITINVPRRLWAIEVAYGDRSDEYVEALESWHHMLTIMFRFGGKVYKDDELALLVNSYIQLGLIFHPKRNKCPLEHESYDASQGCKTCFGQNSVRDELLGTWSSHS